MEAIGLPYVSIMPSHVEAIGLPYVSIMPSHVEAIGLPYVLIMACRHNFCVLKQIKNYFLNL